MSTEPPNNARQMKLIQHANYDAGERFPTLPRARKSANTKYCALWYVVVYRPKYDEMKLKFNQISISSCIVVREDTLNKKAIRHWSSTNVND